MAIKDANLFPSLIGRLKQRKIEMEMKTTVFPSLIGRLKPNTVYGNLN